MKESLPVVKRAVAGVSASAQRRTSAPLWRAGRELMVRHGVPTVTFGAGQNSCTRSMSGSISTNTMSLYAGRAASDEALIVTDFGIACR